jgi:hypothetical protein
MSTPASHTGIGMTSARTRERLVQRLREQGIHDLRVLERIRSLPRHIFVDEALAVGDLDGDENIAAIINKCESDVATGSRPIRVLRSETLPVPVTMGLAQPLIILPDALLREGNSDLLTSAIGHEFIHVARNDYLLNFIYELLYLPLSFHPYALPAAVASRCAGAQGRLWENREALFNGQSQLRIAPYAPKAQRFGLDVPNIEACRADPAGRARSRCPSPCRWAASPNRSSRRTRRSPA